MEVEAAKRIWQRSADTGLRYTTVLRDGDSKAWVSFCPHATYNIVVLTLGSIFPNMLFLFPVDCGGFLWATEAKELQNFMLNTMSEKEI